MENQTASPTPYRIAATIVAILTLAAAVFLFAKKGGEGHSVSNALPGITATSTTMPELPTKENPVIKGNGYTISLDNGSDLPPAPNYKTPIAYSANTAPDVRAQLDKNVVTLISRIDKDKYDLRSWIDLGTEHKIGGDYKTAATFWTYVTKLAPNNATAFDNLGDLYQNFLKDYTRAESNWLASITVEPKDTNPYRALFDLYKDLEKKPTAAEAIIKKGIEANPNALDLYVILARFYKEQGRVADAQNQYQFAIKAAVAAGQPDSAAQIRAEAGL